MSEPNGLCLGCRKLQEDKVHLQQELAQSREKIKHLEEREKLLTDRLVEQAQRQLDKGTKFENLNLGESRPTQLVRRYGNLYTQCRLDAYDALESMPEIAEYEDLKGKLLFSVVVLAFRSAAHSLKHIKTKIQQLLCYPSENDPLCAQVQHSVEHYLRQTVDKYDISKNIEEVCQQVFVTLFDYPGLRLCVGLRRYIEESVRLAWALTIQNPPLVLQYDFKVFHPIYTTRFHSSDPESQTVKTVLWPALVEGTADGACLFKAVVIT